MNRDSSVAGLASLVQSRGRNGDSVLVHMSPEEVHGLQRVALAAGGSLTINPDTGLVEANFLKKLLPTLLGFGLNFLFPGLGAIGSGLLVGGVEAARTGDLGKGLMAGLGAFGGAGFGSALSGVGAAAGDASTKFLAEEAAQGLGKEAGAKAAQEAVSNQIRTMAANPTLSNFGAGAKELFTGGQKLGLGGFGAAKAVGSVMGMPAVAGLGMSAANAMTPDYQMPDLTGEINDSYYQSYGYDPAQGRFLGGQFIKGYPGFPGYAEGGSVMPRPNYSYPQAGITRSSYAPTLDYTRPQEVVDGYEVKLDPFTGEERFADGGEVGMMAPDELKNFLTVSPGAPMPTTPLPEEPVYATPAPYTGPMIAEEYDMAPRMPDFYPDRIPPSLPTTPFQAQPQQSLEDYYRGLLTPPQQRPADNSFMNYMQSLNNYVTSPVAPPKPPVQPPQTPPNQPPGNDRVTGTGGTGTGMVYDPTTGRFVPGTGSPGDSGIDLDALRDAVSGMFPGFNMNFGDLGNYLQNGGYGSTTGLTYDPATGSFRQPGSQTTTTPPGTATTDLNQNQNQFDPNQFKFDQDGFQFNPFVDGFDMSSLPGYGQDQTMPQGNLTGIDQFADPMYSSINTAANQGQMNGMDPSAFHLAQMSNNQPFQYDFSGLGQMNQMGDMGGYGTQFQGFQPLSTDFGSTYQAPAMSMPTFDYSAYSPQQTDFGSMGNYGLGALGTTYAAPTFQMPSFDFGSQAAAVPTTSFQAPMTTGMDSTAATAPQFGFGNSDVLYGQTNFGQGGEQNIFGFASGGAIQKAAAGKLITGDGDGMSDDIRANINGDQEARLADGEFVIPADVVSHIGNGSTDAGADKLYTMMDRIRKARTGRIQQAPEIDAEKYFPA